MCPSFRLISQEVTKKVKRKNPEIVFNKKKKKLLNRIYGKV